MRTLGIATVVKSPIIITSCGATTADYCDCVLYRSCQSALGTEVILFLDFDGVLHPAEAYLVPSGKVVMRLDGHNLFEYAPHLERALENYPHTELQIVLSTSWVPHEKSWQKAAKWLPEKLRERVISGTWSPADQNWHAKTRWQQIGNYVRRNHVKYWLAIDDVDAGWPSSRRQYLVCTDEWLGIGHAEKEEELVRKIEYWLGEERKGIIKL